MLAAAKVCVNLAGEQGVLGDVRPPAVVIQRQEEQPGDPDDDEGEGQVRRELEDPGIAP